MFMNPIKHDISMMVNIMRYFGGATGLQINLSKSAVPTICYQGTDMEATLKNFPGIRAPFSITYLGLPLTLGRLRLSHL